MHNRETELVIRLFLQEAASYEGGHRGEQPLDAPQLDGLPVEQGTRTEKQADGKSSDEAEDTGHKGADGRSGEAEALGERGEFGSPRDFKGAGAVQTGTLGTAGMAVK
ncbi:MAG: hypothetical protein ABSG02_18065 [Terriglobales bacterium]